MHRAAAPLHAEGGNVAAVHAASKKHWAELDIHWAKCLVVDEAAETSSERHCSVAVEPSWAKTGEGDHQSVNK